MDDRSDTGTGAGVGEAFGQVGQELADALRREVEQLRTEMAERLESAARAGKNLAAAGAFGGIAAAAAGSLPLIALRKLLPAWLLAVLIAVGAGGIAAYFARRALDDVAEITPIDPERVKDAAKDAIRQAR